MNWKTYWTNWLQKLITQLISVKVWVIMISTILVIAKIITPTIYSTIIITVIGIKGAYTVAGIAKNKIDKLERGD